jgi:hypothetical protein
MASYWHCRAHSVQLEAHPWLSVPLLAARALWRRV